MRNPLMKRIPRELIGEFGKYIAIFLFMVATIGFISGFLVATQGLKIEYDNSFEKYNVEYGHFVLKKEATEKLTEKISNHGIKLYEQNYNDLDVTAKGEPHGIMRVFKPRDEVNKVDLLDGRMIESDDEIVADRLYLSNNDLEIGDVITMQGNDFKVVGIVALTDYSTLYKNNNEIMFDSVAFGAGIVSERAFDDFGKGNLNYSYAWLYDKVPEDKQAEKKDSDDLAYDISMDCLNEDNELTIFIPRYANKSINFAGEDIGKDRPMMLVLLYILIAIMAFVFAVTINHSVVKEANVIGTLRASGYTKREIFVHYMISPMLVTFIASIIGNILGYTVFEDIAKEMYRGSYGLTHYVSYFNMDAFVRTTVVPMIIMIVVTGIGLWRKLSYSPLNFIRRDIVKHRREKAVKLPKIGFFSRFRLRVIIQNIPNYVTLFFGILFSCLLLMFGMIMTPLLHTYSDNAVAYKPANYQYILSSKQEVDPEIAEKYCVTSLKMIDSFFNPEEMSIYGIMEDSRFYKNLELPKEGVVVTADFAEKYRVGVGDIINLREEYGTGLYAFEIKGIYETKSSLGIYMRQKYFCEVFEKMIDEHSDSMDMFGNALSKIMGERDESYYNGYLSDIDLRGKYLNEENIAAMITEDDLTSLARQMDVSMGDLFNMLYIFALVLFALLIFLLTKIILEKNITSISMTKILGYYDGEISRLYLLASVWVVIISSVLSMAINTALFHVILRIFMKGYGGWFELVIPLSLYFKIFIMMVLTYLVVAVFQFFRIKKIPMDEALKNVE